MNLLKYLWRPLNLYKRDREFYWRHAQGPLSSHDIIAIEYGTASPRGWDIKKKSYHDIPVKIGNPLTDKDMPLLMRPFLALMTLGYVKGGDNSKRDIIPPSLVPIVPMEKPALAINKLIFSPLGQAGVLYLAAHIARSLGPALLSLNPLTFFKATPLLSILMLTSARNQPFTQILTLPFRPAMDTIGHENIHVLQKRDPYETKSGYNIFRNSFKEAADKALTAHFHTSVAHKLNRIFSLGMASYFKNDYEIQARLNTVLTHNYERWGRLPRTRHELWAALIDAGLRAPRSIHDELARVADLGRARPQDLLGADRAFLEKAGDIAPFYKTGLSASFNRAAKQLGVVHVAELNSGYWAHIRKDLKEEYWRRTLPFLYGHLAVLCGDEDGLKRMNFTGKVVDGYGAVEIDSDRPPPTWEQEGFRPLFPNVAAIRPQPGSGPGAPRPPQ